MQAMEKALQNLANPMKLRYMKKDQRNFTRKDTPNLFSTIALANEKDGKLAEREMSLPSAFFSREGLEDSAHALFDLGDSGSEEAQINQRTKQSWSTSRPLSLDKVVGSKLETNKGNEIFLGHCTMEDFDLVENVILRLLRKDGHLFLKPHKKDSTKLKDALELDECLEGSEQTQSSVGSIDLHLLSRLLDHVQTLREQKYQHRHVSQALRSLSCSRNVWDGTKRGEKEHKINKNNMKKAIEAATQATKSAVEAAQNASSLVTKNSEVVDKLLQSLKPSTSKATLKKQENKRSLDDPDDSESSSDSEGSSDSNNVKAIAKKIVSQNQYTHVVLGIMLVSSFVWRYIVVKFVKRVKNKVSDPWGYIGGTLTNNFKGLEKEKEDKNANLGEEHSNGLNMQQFNLPLLLNGEQWQGKKISTSNHV